MWYNYQIKGYHWGITTSLVVIPQSNPLNLPRTKIQIYIYIYLYHGAWVDQRVLPWYNYNTTQWLVITVYLSGYSYSLVVILIAFEITLMQRVMIQASYIMLTCVISCTSDSCNNNDTTLVA